MTCFYLQDWGATFVAIESNSIGKTASGTLVDALQKMKIPACGTSGLGVSVLPGTQKDALANLFQSDKTPTIAILDESRVLRYRGPLGKDARQAIEAVISHQEPVDHPDSPVTTGCPIQ